MIAESVPPAIRVILADDAVLVREGIARLLEEEGLEVVGQTPSCNGLDAMVDELKPDLVITDVRMPPSFTTEGLHAAIKLRQRVRELPVLVLSQQIHATYAVDLLGGGARGVGYLLKDRVTSIATFAASVRLVAAGGTAIDEQVVAALMTRSARLGGLESLTVREREVLTLMAGGLSNPAITRRLNLSNRTVESHVGHIFSKLGLLPDMDDDRRVLAVIRHLNSA